MQLYQIYLLYSVSAKVEKLRSSLRKISFSHSDDKETFNFKNFRKFEMPLVHMYRRYVDSLKSIASAVFEEVCTPIFET